MKRNKSTEENKARAAGKKRVSKRQIREAPRQKIRQLLRSFIPPDELAQQTKSDQILI